ncbi:MAG TPA: hypothetical protein VK666_03605, partial [Chryseolinea sp.]|nr:hypothetical protein [Chryseolinea sp.]
MKLKLLMVPPAFAIALLIAVFAEKQPLEQKYKREKAARAKVVIRCGPEWSEIKECIDESDIPLLPGVGTLQWKIRTTSDSAQLYFNQGINTYYGFHIIEAMASFKKAARFD